MSGRPDQQYPMNIATHHAMTMQVLDEIAKTQSKLADIQLEEVRNNARLAELVASQATSIKTLNDHSALQDLAMTAQGETLKKICAKLEDFGVKQRDLIIFLTASVVLASLGTKVVELIAHAYGM